MNLRFLLRIVTRLAVWLLTLSCFGVVLWVIDEILGWDILPDALSLLVRALLVAGGIIAFVLVVMNLILSLALLAEANASRAELPDFSISRRFKRRMRQSALALVVAIALLMGGLQVVNQLRVQASVREARVEFNQAQAEMNQSIEEVLGLFTPPLLDAINTNTLAEQGQLGNLQKLFNSIQSSFPRQPSVSLVVPATQEPYRYARIDKTSITANDNGQFSLVPQLYTGFPSEEETQAIEQLFSGDVPSLESSLNGNVLRNIVPSSWGVLERDGEIMAIVYLQANDRGAYDWVLDEQSFHHKGPEKLLTN